MSEEYDVKKMALAVIAVVIIAGVIAFIVASGLLPQPPEASGPSAGESAGNEEKGGDAIESPPSGEEPGNEEYVPGTEETPMPETDTDDLPEEPPEGSQWEEVGGIPTEPPDLVE